jgi:DoxX-like family
MNARPQRAIGIELSVLAVLFLLMDAGMKLLAVPAAVSTTAQLGYPGTTQFVQGLGALLLVCTLLYAWPRTAVLGAILLTGYLGGAVATHVRASSPVFSHILFGAYIGIFIWGGLWLREERLRSLLLHR